MEARRDQEVINQGKVQDILSRLTLPPEMDRVETKYGTDHTGDPAVFLTFYLKADVHVEREEIKHLSRFISGVARDLLNADVGGFPYTRLEDAA